MSRLPLSISAKLVDARKPPARRPGFTLVELLTVISIIAILAGILIPVIGNVQISARKAKSTSNLQSIGHALMLYAQADDNRGLLPAPVYGDSSASGSSAGSANPTQGTWLEEIVTYLDGTVQHVAGSKTVIVTTWPSVLTDPQYLADNSVITDTEQDKRGYGMNTKLYLPDMKNKSRTTPNPTQRQLLNKLPDHANNVVVTLSNDVIAEPGDDGLFGRDATGYTNGDPTRYHGYGLYLFLDESVEPLTPDQAQKYFAPPPTGN